jgi:hypothetical protein
MPQDLEPMSPEMDHTPEPTAAPAEVVGLHGGESDREGAMAKADLFKLANYSHKLYEQLSDEDQLESWVQAKITKAADYIASVYHYLEYEMKFSEYGKHLDSADTMSESQKEVLKSRLLEAKMKIKELKQAQASKIAGTHTHKLSEGILSGGERACTECGGTGMVYEEPKEVPAHVKNKVEKYKTLVKATKAAHKRLDANNNGVPDDEEVEEGFGEADSKEMKVGDKKKTRTGELEKTSTGVKHTNTSYHDDGDEIASNAKSGKGIKSHAKAQSAAEKKDKAPALKKSKTGTWGMENGEKFDNRKKEESIEEAKGKCCCEEKGKTKCPVHGKMSEAIAPTKDLPKKGEKIGKEGNAFGKAVRDAKASGDKTMSVGGKTMPVKEASKPSAGLSAAKKSAVVKDAKAGKDIGKPGKSFDKVAKSAGGGEKGKKIAAAAMWKNIKETTAYVAEKAEVEKKAKKDYDGDGKIESGKDEHAGSVDKAIKASMGKKETVKESTELTRMQDQIARLNRNEAPALVENREVDQIRALTKRLLG